MQPLDEHGLSATARDTLTSDVVGRVSEAWAGGRALILNANKPGYSEAFTVEAEQYRLVRSAIYAAIATLADAAGEVRLQEVVRFVQDALGDHARFPKGRMTNYTRYIKTDLEARGELERVAKKKPQRIRLA